MIFDTMRNWQKNQMLYGSAVQRALNFIGSLNTSEMPDKLEIEGEKMFVLKQIPSTTTFEERTAEVHRLYADIHFVVEGEEWQTYTINGKAIDLIEDKLEERDVAKYRMLENENRIFLTEGSFTVYWPGEYHKTNIHGDRKARLVKLVVKIHNDLI